MPTINNNGINIHYKTEGAGPPLVMLHGFFGTVEDFYEAGYTDALQESHQLVMIDHRGHGQSDKPHTPEQYNFEYLIEDVIEVVNFLGLNKFHLYGHSYGGWFTYSLAMRYPDKILSIINSDGAPGKDDVDFITNIINSLSIETLNKISVFSPERRNRFLANDKQALLSIAEWMSANPNVIFNEINEAIMEINCPCLFLQSNAIEDGSEEFRIISKAVNTIENATLKKFEDLSHLELFAKSELVLPAIKEFLDSIYSET